MRSVENGNKRREGVVKIAIHVPKKDPNKMVASKSHKNEITSETTSVDNKVDLGWTCNDCMIEKENVGRSKVT